MKLRSPVEQPHSRSVRVQLCVHPLLSFLPLSACMALGLALIKWYLVTNKVKGVSKRKMVISRKRVTGGIRTLKEGTVS